MNTQQENENKLIQELRHWIQTSLNEIYTNLDTSLEGISEEEAIIRLEKEGLNEIMYDQSSPWYAFLLKSFLDPFILILASIVLISYFTDIALVPTGEKSWMTIIIISIMILISVALRFTQEYKSQITADNLKSLVPTTTAIKRKEHAPKEIVMANVVPGDIIYLAAGDLIPADMRLITTKDLFISQSSLTGESEPVEKFAEPKMKRERISISDLENIGLMGTIVISGAAQGVVLQTGDNTYLGSIADSLSQDSGETSFERGVKSVSMLLIRFMVIMVPIVFLINGITKNDWIGALLFAISVAVGLTPEMLPTLVSTNLAKGAISLSNKKIVVKRLSSIQNFGAMDILCTDKTGTLTEDEIVLEKYLDTDGEESERVLRHGFLNSYYQTGLKNLLDVAVIKRGEDIGFNHFTHEYTKVDEIPFDFMRRRMSVVVESEQNKRQLITKGAVEEMLSICSFVEIKGRVVPLNTEMLTSIKEITDDLNNQGMRVLGIAQKKRSTG